ncbi:ABC transporter substrate-binding protein [Aliifodinibius salicampi]|uniref:ABC transporter substrate-binding protein n=1 Tax=Fodinibius salicampi TaxID=1920655 RepID=A0ABT3PZC4_9BACT|nr:ABC transporter substrate-binding protein [Fodinibius salicampi]MCW9713131.1 ABC transporter substrate-binding protein [Fodinibius salicampi]
MNLSSAKPLLAFLIVLMALASCKQPETVIVDREPNTAVAHDTTTQEDTTKRDASFRQLVIGEYQPITTLDPLQASSATEMRAVQLLYEGLVRFDGEGNITPAIARDWSVENDNRKYTFRLRTDVYFHDNDRFGSGTGRKLMAKDIKFALERSARSGVSPKAAHLFMDISGFEPYFQEQRNLYNPDHRQLDGVSGIQAPNDSTVVITLNNTDPDFLHKLATPLAVIYPKEAVGNNNSFEPIGSGPFTFSRQQNDSTHIFSKFDNYYNSSDISLNRVDIISSTDGQTLWNNMQSGDIHYLPELGPTLSQQLLNENGNLTSSYSNRYQKILAEGEITFTLHHNPNSNLPNDVVTGIGQIVQSNASALFENMDYRITETSFKEDNNGNSISLDYRTVNIARITGHPYSQQLLNNLSMLLDQNNADLSISNSRIPHQGIGLFITERQPLIPERQWALQPSILQFSVQSIAVARSEIKNLTQTPYPWWIDVRNILLPPIENLN